MAKKRITELATETTLKDGQYVAIDHTTDGTKKLNLGAELTNLKEDLGDLKSALNANTHNNLVDLIASASFEKGSIDPNTGDAMWSNNRIRSDFIDVSDATHLILTPSAGYKVTYQAYGSSKNWLTTDDIGTYFTNTMGTWQTSTLTVLLIPKIKYIRVLVADTSDSTSISATDKNNATVLADYELYNQIENSKRNSGVFYENETGYQLPLLWSAGIPDGGYTRINNTGTRIHSSIITDLPSSGFISINPESGYKAAYYVYDSNFNYKQLVYWGEYKFALQPDYKYIIVGLSKSNDSNIYPSEGANVTVKLFPAWTALKYPQKADDVNDNSMVDISWELGTLVPSTGEIYDSTTRIRSGYILVGKGTVLSLSDKTYSHLIYKFDFAKGYVSDATWTHDDIVIDSDCYIRILMAKPNNTTISSSEVEAVAEKERIYLQTPQALIEDYNFNNPIPDYYTNKLETAVDSVRQNMFDAGINGDSFVFFSDLHWQSNVRRSPDLIKHILDKSNVGKVICGGDLIGGGDKNEMISLMSDCVTAFHDIGRFYVLFGNHDTNYIGSTSSDYFTNSEAYALLQKESDFLMEYGGLCYFFFDNPTTKTRYICLDTGYEGTTLGSTQETWIRNTLDSMPSGYHALVFGHIIYQPTTSWHVGLTPSELEMTDFMSDVCAILDAFNSNNNDKKVEAIFGGHVHIDCNFATSGGIPIVLIDTDSRQTFTTTDGTTADNKVGTVQEQCVDVVTVNYSAKTIKCVRVGRGNNRIVSY